MSYLSVTQVIPKPKGLSKVHPDILDTASERGKKAHGALHTYCYSIKENDPIYIPVSPGTEPYFRSGKRWIDQYVFKILYVEIEVFHPLYQYVGHPDLIAILKGDTDPSVIDFKTPIQYQEKHWSAQLSAYKQAFLKDPNYPNEDFNLDKLLSVRLKNDGGYPLVNQVTNERLAFQGFLNALGSYRYFKG